MQGQMELKDHFAGSRRSGKLRPVHARIESNESRRVR